MKRPLLLSLTLSLLAANAFALPASEQTAPQIKSDAATISQPIKTLAEDGSDRTQSATFAEDGADRTKSATFAEDGADRTKSATFAEDGSDRTKSATFAEDGSSRVKSASFAENGSDRLIEQRQQIS
ncbi:hypothetical protein NPS46_11875 [Pseudomonas putida]|uniref:hypothetical protein n=1 Tax=Pseudomonas putida TaxID=303 RepID=UPI0023649E50|nr:hypothetical protein [Pseudomonas putida]MDD2053243.1 hypothetical protein [Pseudomonas putida]